MIEQSKRHRNPIDADRLFHVTMVAANANGAMRRHMDQTHKRYIKEWSVGN